MENPVAPSNVINPAVEALSFDGALINEASPSAISPVSFAQIPCVVQLALLQAEVESLLVNPWVDHVNKQDYSGGWDVLPLRCQRQYLDAHPILQGFSIADGEDWENLPVMAQCPELQNLFNQLQCPIKAARLMRLKAGAAIKPHRDHELSMEFGEARLHVPIHTSDAVSFLVEHKLIPMRAGELWYFNADQIHEVYNRGSEDRINVVIDCVVNDWLRQKISSSVAHG
ncbi:aspartyl/asparaginyl beta-hydroxylase domain-containing protein [Cellvibrio mixtus]|uniref:aspartyl/asparaginyl beta-hydroxylase domain-containing protein n=1 Tax=Cellvibrio mixtus TaxID=39650 RepID=UPI000A03B9C7|nr:aspartyl/asparaginyl beta-hydroxylase domain-containing protein [Cellvibrio mixtus]